MKTKIKENKEKLCSEICRLIENLEDLNKEHFVESIYIGRLVPSMSDIVGIPSVNVTIQVK